MIDRRPFAGPAVALLGMSWLAVAAGVAGGREAGEARPGDIRRTQVTIALGEDGLDSRFQASVIAKGDGELTVLTAAHCLSADDVGKVAQVGQGGAALVARVGSVTRNPAYRPTSNREVPGVDNAVAVLKVDLAGDRGGGIFEGIRAADVAARPVPDPGGKTVYVEVVDQFGEGHALRAENYSNPKWLEWGRSFRPEAGDSGSGVFAYLKDPAGGTRPVLIGLVVGRSDRGGGASLVCKRNRWIDEAVARKPTR